ncbi:hypothetical protein B2I21_07395 [Chryseobacterium mucoviscidosis]|nr:hypothetical protein B2I21_07395 [Chryseobacterium mucoviscidosis]
MGAAVIQMEFYQSVTDAERDAAKSMLRRYTRMKRTVDELGLSDALNEKQQAIYKDWKLKTDNIERAVRVIIDHELKKMVEYRFIQGLPRKSALIKFRSISERSFDRRIVDGIKSVASTLKLWDVL